MNTDRLLFGVGFILVIVGFVSTQVIWMTMSPELRILWEQELRVGVVHLGDVMWSTLSVGIILIGLGYWRKPRKP